MRFLHPQFLWFGLLAVPLVLFYVLKVRRDERPVASTLLWTQAMAELQAQVPFRRLRRDWLLLLELLLLAALVLAAASPYHETEISRGSRSVLVLDASASMRVESRFGEAQRQAKRLLAGLKATDEVLVLRAGAVPRVVLPFANDRSRAEAAVSQMSAGLSAGSLPEAVKLARELAGAEGDVFLYTDGTRPVPVDPHLNVVLLGTDLANTGIVAVGVRPRDASGLSQDVFVRLASASSAAAPGVLRLSIDGHVKGASALTIPPEGEARHIFAIDGIEEGTLELTWQPEVGEAFTEDDRALWRLRKAEPRTLMMTGRPHPALSRAVEVNADWHQADASPSVEIANAGRPAEAGPPLLWVNPPRHSTSTASASVVLNWVRSHPSLRFVDLSPVRFGVLGLSEPRPGFRTLASTTRGPLISEGRLGTRRAIVWDFDLSETDLVDRTSFPILVRNTLAALAEGTETLPGGIPTGKERNTGWPLEEKVRLISPSGETLALDARGGSLRLPALEEAGLYRLAGSSREVAFAASLLNEPVTDLRPRATGQASAPRPAKTRESGRTPRLLLAPLALAAMALVLVDALAFHRRWSP